MSDKHNSPPGRAPCEARMCGVCLHRHVCLRRWEAFARQVVRERARGCGDRDVEIRREMAALNSIATSCNKTPETCTRVPKGPTKADVCVLVGWLRDRRKLTSEDQDCVTGALIELLASRTELERLAGEVRRKDEALRKLKVDRCDDEDSPGGFCDSDLCAACDRGQFIDAALG